MRTWSLVSSGVAVVLMLWSPFGAGAQVRAAGRALTTPSTAQSGVVEGEALVPGAVANGGSVSSQSMSDYGTGWSGGAQLFWSARGAGAVLDLTVEVAAPAQYAVELYFTKAPDYGQVGIEVAGQASPVTLDGYAPRVMAPIPTQAGRFALDAGPRTFSLKILGKNRSSGGYRVGLDQIRLYPVGAIEGNASASASRAAQARGVAAPTAVVVAAGGPKNPGGGSPPPTKDPPKQPGPECDSTCLGNVATVYRRADDGGCRTWFRFPCSPYGCDATLGLCREACSWDGECAQGAVCDTTTGLCASDAARCFDNVTVKMPNGQTESCMPFTCVAGACQNVCTSPSGCGPGYTCNTGTGLCVPSPKK